MYGILFQGDTDGLIERGLCLGSGTKKSVPGKMFANKSIYGNDGTMGGGTSVFKSKTALVCVVFSANPTIANRVGLRTAEFMIENNR